MKFSFAKQRVIRNIFYYLTGHRFYANFSTAVVGEDGKTYLSVYEKYDKPLGIRIDE